MPGVPGSSSTVAAGLLALMVAAAAAPTPPAAAQTVQGTVVDDERGRPLAGATLLLLDSASMVVDSARVDPDGAFRLRAAPGTYIVQVHLDGWVDIPSETFTLTAGEVHELDLRVPLVSVHALQQMGAMIREDDVLQRPLDEVCGEELRLWEAGLLVGIIRDRRSRDPVAGAQVAAATADGEVLRSTLSTEQGTYILCNLPAGAAIRVTAEAPDGRRGATEPDIRAGMTAWYDVFLRPSRR